MFKAFVLISRKPGTTHEEFVQYYEEKHSVLGASIVPNMTRYVRHFVRPFGDQTYAADASPYDVLTEFCFDTEEDFLEGMRALGEPSNAELIGAGEAKFMDRGSISFYTAQSFATDMESGKSMGRVE